MVLVNLTPHAVCLLLAGGTVEIPPSGTVARCAAAREQVAEIALPDGTIVPVNRTVFGAVDGLPAPQDGTIYIVSSLVAQAVRDRMDLLIPDDSVRDDQGRIVGCRALARV